MRLHSGGLASVSYRQLRHSFLIGASEHYYYAWVEWWPAYNMIKEFTLNPGDDISIASCDTGPTQVITAPPTRGKKGRGSCR